MAHHRQIWLALYSFWVTVFRRQPPLSDHPSCSPISCSSLKTRYPSPPDYCLWVDLALQGAKFHFSPCFHSFIDFTQVTLLIVIKFISTLFSMISRCCSYNRTTDTNLNPTYLLPELIYMPSRLMHSLIPSRSLGVPQSFFNGEFIFFLRISLLLIFAPSERLISVLVLCCFVPLSCWFPF